MTPVNHLFIALLSYRTEIDMRVTDAIEAAQNGLMRMGWLSTRVSFGSADLCDGRNTLVSQFYVVPNYTHILCVDADVSWGAGAVERLVQHPVDVVIGAYPKRADGEGYAVRTLPGPVTCVDPKTGAPHPRGLVEIAAGPGGMMLLSRKAVARLVEARPDDWYHQPKVTGGKAWNLFEFTVADHQRTSEDMNLCLRWRGLGGTVWCDPHITLHHHGAKSYSGKFIDHLREIGRLADGAAIAQQMAAPERNAIASAANIE